MSFWTWLTGAEGETEPDALGEVQEALAVLPDGRARFVAAFAYILTRSARADYQVTDGEAREMERIVAEKAGVSLEQASVVVRLARAQARRSGGTDDFVVTREFERLASYEGKIALLDALFVVSSVDESIVTLEDNEIRRVATELKVDHPDFIAVRARHIQHLQSLKNR